MSFDAWHTADPDAAGNGDDLNPPDDGTYEVTLIGAAAFTAKSDAAFVKNQYQVLTGPAAGYEWTVLLGFKSQEQANVTKKACRDLGVEIDAITSQEALSEALEALVGQYYTVEVKTNGKFRNTYIQGPLVGSDLPAPPPEPVTAGAPSDDDGVPF